MIVYQEIETENIQELPRQGLDESLGELSLLFLLRIASE
jgi:hypothetical protein